MTLPLPGNPVDDDNIQAKFDTISVAWPNRSVGVFNSYRAAALAIPNNTGVIFDTEKHDVSGWHNTADGKYTPKVAGYYRISWALTAAQPAGNTIFSALLTTGGVFRKRGTPCLGNGFSNARTFGSGNVFANGTTDSFQVFFFHDVVGNLALVTGEDNCYFDGELISP